MTSRQSTSLVSFNTATDSSSSDGIVSVLASKTDFSPENDDGTCTLSFRAGERQFSASADAAYSILHYKSLPENVVSQDAGSAQARRWTDLSRVEEPLDSAMDFEVHQPHAEVLLQGVNKGLGGGRASTYYITCMCQLRL
jgi:hypothetical protein